MIERISKNARDETYWANVHSNTQTRSSSLNATDEIEGRLPFPDRLAKIFVEAARKAGVAACVPIGRIAALPNLKNVKSCDEERAKLPG